MISYNYQKYVIQMRVSFHFSSSRLQNIRLPPLLIRACRSKFPEKATLIIGADDAAIFLQMTVVKRRLERKSKTGKNVRLMGVFLSVTAFLFLCNSLSFFLLNYDVMWRKRGRNTLYNVKKYAMIK